MTEAIAIAARGRVEDVAAILHLIDTFAKRHDVFLQLVDPAAVYNERHIASAYLHAERAHADGTASSKTLAGEFLSYLTGERQVSDALPKAGIRAGLERTIIVAAGARAGTAIWGILDKLGWNRDPAGLGTNPAALERLGLPTTPARTPEQAILEHVALLDVRK